MCRRLRQVLALFLAISVGVLLSGGVASAGTVTIWPDQFSTSVWDDEVHSTYQNPDTLAGNANYYCTLNIPVGKIIKFIRVNYNSPAASGYSFDVSLRRKSPSTLAETLILLSITPPEGTLSVQSNATHVSGPLTIKSGYRYFIKFEPGIEGSINSIQVVYN